MRKAFTLPELLIAVTLSAILMTGMLIFLSSGIGNAWKLKKEAGASVSSSVFEDRVGEVASMGAARIVHSGNYPGYGSGILLFQSGSNLPLSFLASDAFTGYCDGQSGAVLADGKIYRIFLAQTESPYFNGTSGIFSLSGNLVMSGSDILVGKERDYSEEDLIGSSGSNPRKVSLLHPKAILSTSDGLFIADTGKNRILAYSGGNVYPTISADAGIVHPDMLRQNGVAVEVRWSANLGLFQDAPICNSALPDFSTILPTDISFDTIIIRTESSHITLPTSTGAYIFYGNAPEGLESLSDGVKLSFAAPPISSPILNISGIQMPSPVSGAYHLSIELLSGGASLKTLYSPLVTCGDGSILSLSGNTFSSAPAPLYSDINGVSYDFSTFTGNLPWSETSLSPFPVSDFSWTADADMLTISFLEYINYDCALENHERRERVIKIPLR